MCAHDLSVARYAYVAVTRLVARYVYVWISGCRARTAHAARAFYVYVCLRLSRWIAAAFAFAGFTLVCCVFPAAPLLPFTLRCRSSLRCLLRCCVLSRCTPLLPRLRGWILLPVCAVTCLPHHVARLVAAFYVCCCRWILRIWILRRAHGSRLLLPRSHCVYAFTLRTRLHAHTHGLGYVWISPPLYRLCCNITHASPLLSYGCVAFATRGCCHALRCCVPHYVWCAHSFAFARSLWIAFTRCACTPRTFCCFTFVRYAPADLLPPLLSWLLPCTRICLRLHTRSLLVLVCYVADSLSIVLICAGLTLRTLRFTRYVYRTRFLCRLGTLRLSFYTTVGSYRLVGFTRGLRTTPRVYAAFAFCRLDFACRWFVGSHGSAHVTRCCRCRLRVCPIRVYGCYGWITRVWIMVLHTVYVTRVALRFIYVTAIHTCHTRFAFTHGLRTHVYALPHAPRTRAHGFAGRYCLYPHVTHGFCTFLPRHHTHVTRGLIAHCHTHFAGYLCLPRLPVTCAFVGSRLRCVVRWCRVARIAVARTLVFALRWLRVARFWLPLYYVGSLVAGYVALRCTYATLRLHLDRFVAFTHAPFSLRVTRYLPLCILFNTRIAARALLPHAPHCYIRVTHHLLPRSRIAARLPHVLIVAHVYAVTYARILSSLSLRCRYALCHFVCGLRLRSFLLISPLVCTRVCCTYPLFSYHSLHGHLHFAVYTFCVAHIHAHVYDLSSSYGSRYAFGFGFSPPLILVARTRISLTSLSLPLVVYLCSSHTSRYISLAFTRTRYTRGYARGTDLSLVWTHTFGCYHTFAVCVCAFSSSHISPLSFLVLSLSLVLYLSRFGLLYVLGYVLVYAFSLVTALRLQVTRFTLRCRSFTFYPTPPAILYICLFILLIYLHLHTTLYTHFSTTGCVAARAPFTTRTFISFVVLWVVCTHTAHAFSLGAFFARFVARFAARILPVAHVLVSRVCVAESSLWTRTHVRAVLSLCLSYRLPRFCRYRLRVLPFLYQFLSLSFAARITHYTRTHHTTHARLPHGLRMDLPLPRARILVPLDYRRLPRVVAVAAAGLRAHLRILRLLLPHARCAHTRTLQHLPHFCVSRLYTAPSSLDLDSRWLRFWFWILVCGLGCVARCTAAALHAFALLLRVLPLRSRCLRLHAFTQRTPTHVALDHKVYCDLLRALR